ncbi:hypothetical protein GQ42DRAFT_79698 [Ramicandelaber brevisporus]|nr:hypothetical protein GQ42DRAFT_79698 [Ramicandelaber brevisporus]
MPPKKKRQFKNGVKCGVKANPCIKHCDTCVSGTVRDFKQHCTKQKHQLTTLQYMAFFFLFWPDRPQEDGYRFVFGKLRGLGRPTGLINWTCTCHEQADDTQPDPRPVDDVWNAEYERCLIKAKEYLVRIKQMDGDSLAFIQRMETDITARAAAPALERPTTSATDELALFAPVVTTAKRDRNSRGNGITAVEPEPGSVRRSQRRLGTGGLEHLTAV